MIPLTVLLSWKSEDLKIRDSEDSDTEQFRDSVVFLKSDIWLITDTANPSKDIDEVH